MNTRQNKELDYIVELVESFLGNTYNIAGTSVEEIVCLTIVVLCMQQIAIDSNLETEDKK